MARYKRQTSFPRFSWQMEEIGALQDELGREAMARDIAGRIRGPERPGVIGIYGSWGAGKTYLMSQVIRALLEANCQEETQVLVCLFEAWKYEMEGNLAAGLIRSLAGIDQSSEKFCRFPGCCHPAIQLPEKGPSFKDIARELIHLILQVGPEVASLFMPGAAGTAVRAVGKAAGKAAEEGLATRRNLPLEILEALTDKIHRAMNDLVEGILDAAYKADSTRQYRLAIFIDDLDRCSPENMVHMFEWMKVHLRAENCTYVIALDHTAAARAIVGHYREYLGEEKDIAYGFRYLEKLVDLEYELGSTQEAERMAIRQVFHHPTWQRLSDMARAEYGDYFPGWMEMDMLLALPSMCTPRTMLKVAYKFRNLFGLLMMHRELRSGLPASFPFWLLFLIAMYYRLDPEHLIEFVEGRGPIYEAFKPKDKAVQDQEVGQYTGPLKEFVHFALQAAPKIGALQMPSRELMAILAKIVRENVIPGGI